MIDYMINFRLTIHMQGYSGRAVAGAKQWKARGEFKPTKAQPMTCKTLISSHVGLASIRLGL
eukprot:428519-Pelagomonas_calceolata.AAC.4